MNTTLAELLLIWAEDRARRALGRAAYWAGRAAGAREQIREAWECATLPLDVPSFPWRKAARVAVAALRGADVRPYLRIRNMARNVAREAAAAHEERLRQHFARTRAERN